MDQTSPTIGAPSDVPAGALPPTAVAQRPWPAITLAPDDRILVLSPHPDDEVIGAGGVIQEAIGRGLPLRVVFLTNGDNNEWSFMVYRRRPELLPGEARQMGVMRQGEARSAAAELGVPPESLTFLGYPDFGTLHIWM